MNPENQAPNVEDQTISILSRICNSICLVIMFLFDQDVNLGNQTSLRYPELSFLPLYQLGFFLILGFYIFFEEHRQSIFRFGIYLNLVVLVLTLVWTRILNRRNQTFKVRT